ncbi:unnamed protein product [Alternaria alternata]
MELEVLAQYGELDRIGQPEALDTEAAEAQPAAISGNNFYGSKTAPAPQPQRSLPTHQSTPWHFITPQPLPYRISIAIRTQVDYPRAMHRQERHEGMAQPEGGWQAVQLADKLYPVFEVGTVYYIGAPCRVTLAKKQFKNPPSPNDYELQLERETEVEKAEDQENKPQIRFNFTKIADVADVEKDATIDTVGSFKEVAEVTTITSKNTNKDYSKRELTLADDSQTSIRLTISGKTAETFEAPLESIVAFKGAKVSGSRGRSLSLLSSGTMMVDPDIDEAHKLRGTVQRRSAECHILYASKHGSGCWWIQERSKGLSQRS